MPPRLIPPPRHQTDIAAISAVLESRLDLDVADIALHAEAGRVTVTGTLPLRRMAHQIQTLIEAQPGVVAVDMRVDVTTPNFAEADRLRSTPHDPTGIVDDERNRQTGHEI